MAGLAIMSVPLYWRIAGNYRNQQMVKEIEQIIEQETENEEEEDHGQTALEAAISEEDAAALSKEEVIGLIEIEALDIKYAVLEGAGSYMVSCGKEASKKAIIKTAMIAKSGMKEVSIGLLFCLWFNNNAPITSLV